MGLQDGPLHGDFEKAHNPFQFYDYSEESKKAWVRFLKEVKHLSLKEVNTLTGKNFPTWEDVTLPPAFEYKGGRYREKIWSLFTEFQVYGVANVFERLFIAIRSVDKNTPVEIRVGGGANEWFVKGFDFSALVALCKKYNGILVQTNSASDMQVSCLGSLTKSFYLPFSTEVGTPPNEFQVARGLFNTIKVGGKALFYCYWQAGRPADDWAYLKPLWKKVINNNRITDNICLLHISQLPSYDEHLIKMARKKNNFFTFFSDLNYQYSVLMLPSQIPQDKKIILFDANNLWIDEEWRRLLDKHIADGGILVLNYLSDSQNGYGYLKQLLPGIKIDTLKSQENIIYNIPEKKEIILSTDEGIKFSVPAEFTDRIDILTRWGDGSIAAFSYKKENGGKMFLIGFPFTDFVPFKGSDGKQVIEYLFKKTGIARHIIPSEYGVQAVVLYDTEGHKKLVLYNGNNYTVESRFFVSGDRIPKRGEFSLKVGQNTLLLKEIF
ncbi:MAG: hypothetical protein NC905_06275 [Candidatus Omnitrophica bacterium]|nr:hypothetical protein [Candidatus Omnitrophota bacterium]